MSDRVSLVTNSSTGCLTCHTFGLADRSGGLGFGSATTGVDFDTYDRAITQRDRIIVRAVDQDNMPPTGVPLNSSEQSLLSSWQSAGFPKAAPIVSTFTEANITATVTKTAATLKATVNPNVHAATTVPATANFQYG